jgi:hypothetical protein
MGLLAIVLPDQLTGQSLAQRLAAVTDGTVRFSFAARPGVCGNGRNIISDRNDRDWESACDDGPVRVVVSVANRRMVALRAYVGGRWRAGMGDVTDFGTVPARAAVDLLLSVARSADSDVGAKAIFPATLADSVDPWPGILAIARNQQARRETRKQAVFWLGQAASDVLTRGLDSLLSDRNEDRAIQEQVVFALSRRPNDESIPALTRVARTHPDPEIRKKAIFWLAQSDDPRAVALFEQLLLK